MYTPVGATVDAGLPRQLELPPAACTARRPISNLTTPDDPLSNTPRTGPWDLGINLSEGWAQLVNPSSAQYISSS